jgi:hypothetical protein
MPAVYTRCRGHRSVISAAILAGYPAEIAAGTVG